MWWCVQGMLRICWMSSAVNFWCPSLVVQLLYPYSFQCGHFPPPAIVVLDSADDQLFAIWIKGGMLYNQCRYDSKYSNTFQTFSDRVLLCFIYRCSLVSSTHFSWLSALPPFLVYLTGRVLLTYSWPQLSKCDMMRLDLIISSNNNWYVHQLWQSLI